MQSTRTRHPVVLYSRHGERGATWCDVARELTGKRARRALSIWVQVRLNVGCKKRLGVRAGGKSPTHSNEVLVTVCNGRVHAGFRAERHIVPRVSGVSLSNGPDPLHLGNAPTSTLGVAIGERDDQGFAHSERRNLGIDDRKRLRVALERDIGEYANG